MTGRTIWSVGHSNKEPGRFVEMLAAAGIRTVADVRRYPHSRRQPWTNVDSLNRLLFAANIRYVYLGDELGGHRDARPDSPHVALAGSSFQGYADHMQGAIFSRGLALLEAEASQAPTAFLCSERNPKKCHRRILSDRLAATDWTVLHLLDEDVVQAHKPSPAATWDGQTLLYRGAALKDFG